MSADFSTQYAWFRIDARRAGCVRIAGARGFTLIELMAAILIVALLVAVALPSYAAIIKKQRIGEAIRDLSKLAGDIERYRTVHFATPMSLTEIGAGGMLDPWGNPYQYLSFDDPSPGINGKIRKDHNLHPINSDFDLYSSGPDGDSKSPLTAKASRDDIIYGRDGSFIGVAEDF